MTVSEKIVLREDVARPADKAAESVERLAGALGDLGKVNVDAKAAAKIERTEKAASKAEASAKAAAERASSLREKASAAEAKATEAAARAAKLREQGLKTSKADRQAARAAATAERRKSIAERAAVVAEKRQASVARLRGVAEKAQRAAEVAEQKRAAKARRDAQKEERRKAKGLQPKVSKTEDRLLKAVQGFNPAQDRREALLERQLREMRKKARAGVEKGVAEGEHGGGLESLAGGKGQAAAAAALAAAAATVAAAAGRVALDLGEAAVDAAAFREDTMRALEILLKSKRAAERAFGLAVKTADYIGQGRQETLGQFVDLLGKGFDPALVERIVRSIADLGTVNPSANVDSIIRAMGKIKAQGYLQGDELTMLTEAGLSAEKVYDQLARKMGKSSAEIRRMQGAGKLDAASTIEAILGAINEQAGGRAPGLAARAKSLEDITGLLGRLRAMPGNLSMDLQVTPGMRAFKGFVGETIGALDPSGPRWQRITSVLGKVLNSLFRGVFEGQDPGAIIDSILEKVELAQPLFSALVSGFKTGFGGVFGFFSKMDKLAGTGYAKLEKLLGIQDVPWIELVAKGLGLIAGVVGVVLAVVAVAAIKLAKLWMGLYAAVLGAYGVVVSFAEWLGELFSGEGLSASGASIGQALVDGIVSGLQAGAAAVAAAVKGLAGGAVGTAKKAFGIASPSRVFAAIGGHVASGAELGISGGAGRVIRAAEAMALGATRAANDNILSPATAGVGGFAGGGRGGAATVGARAERAAGLVLQFGPGSVQIVVQGSATERDGEAVARGMWAEFKRIAEEAA
jgi:tape measure domain-containing protein